MARSANTSLTAPPAAREKRGMSEANTASGGHPLIRNVCVYCGSAAGVDPLYEQAAGKLGRALARAGIGLIYGGGSRGLLAALARATRENGGMVTAIIPEFLTARNELSEDAQKHIVVPDMHTRKRLMFEQADAFVALPGGIGTLEELVEQLTWVQLERHTKPVVIADIRGFWRPLLALFEHMREHGFIQPAFEVRYLVAEAIEDILPMIETAAARNAALGARKETVDPRM